MVRLGSPAKKFILPGILLILVGLGAGWFLTPSELPGRAVPDMGREHIKETDPEPEYNSNPPTSGSHSPEWIAAGFYESEKSDRNLLHSLEHGYVVVSYNCQIKQELGIRPSPRAQAEGNYELGTVWAHGEEAAESGREATAAGSKGIKGIEGGGGKEGDDGACHELRDYLKNLVKDFGVWKIVAGPRAKNDTRLALTAWGRIDKFNSLDKKRIEKFIKAFRDKGPEATKD